MLGGRWPIVLALMLALLVLATVGVRWLLKQWRESTPPFRVDDVRNLRYVAPYDQWPEPGKEYPMTISVHGPAVSARYETTAPRALLNAIPPRPKWVIEADADEVVTLPDGRAFGIGAILMVPSESLEGFWREYSMEEVHHHPNGRRMTLEEAQNFRLRHGQSIEETLRWAYAGMTYSLCMYLETILDLDEFIELSIRDMRTGGQAATKEPRAPETPLTHDNVPGLVYEHFNLTPVRPAQLALHALLWQGDKESGNSSPKLPSGSNSRLETSPSGLLPFNAITILRL